MKRTVVSEERVCDVEGCEKWCYDSCLGCGVDHCYDHRKKLGVEYAYSAYNQGHGDGYYCHECDKRLRASGEDSLHIAYLEMAALIEERHLFHETFEPKAKDLELTISVLYDKRFRK